MSDQLPIAQLESLKYRATQIMESINALQFLIDANGVPAMPPWPDILARYNLLLSQIHSLSVSLSFSLLTQQQEAGRDPQNPFEKLALHPGISLQEQQLDHVLAPLLRNQPTVQVLKEEDVTVRRLAAVLKTVTSDGVPIASGSEGCQRVVQECVEIKRQHDARVERAIKAVTLLKDRYEWHARVEAPVEEEAEEANAVVEAPGQEENGDDGDVDMTTPFPLAAAASAANGRSSEASTPASSRSDEANEAQVTKDVLGEAGVTPG